MKSPAELVARLRRQWDNQSVRESRLIGSDAAWPILLSIGRPSPKLLTTDLDAVKRHIDAWKRVSVGDVLWENVRYRSADTPISVPAVWRLQKPSEWIRACSNPSIKQEFESLATLIEETDPIFHSLFIRRRSLWRDKPLAEVAQAARVAMALEPGSAAGMPLRAVSIEGIDTKFFERNSRLITTLVDMRFEGEVRAIGLEAFLGALAEGENWLLVVDLDGALLPFRKQRVRSSELRDTALPGTRLLVIENEQCQHLLPSAPGTVAVLGSGFDLSWAEAEWLNKKKVAYWGDIDTWGLLYLAKARAKIPHVNALMMTEKIYRQFENASVPEPVVADVTAPVGLTPSERSLYEELLSRRNGRLEQEFVSKEEVEETITHWLSE